jgi:hypothetical protein
MEEEGAAVMVIIPIAECSWQEISAAAATLRHDGYNRKP